MNKLNVSIVVDAITPQQWMVNALGLLDAHPQMLVASIILQNTSYDPDSHQPSANSLKKTLQRQICDRINRYIDRPRFDGGQKAASQLPEKYQQLITKATSELDAVHSAPSHTDVVLHFGNISRPLPTNTPTAKHGIWFVCHDQLTDLIERSLLTRPSLLWVHLWRWPDQHSPKTERVASHALPIQSFSKTDLSTCGFGCLPTLILSRLNWLSQGLDPAQHEATQVSTEYYSENTLPNAYQLKPLSESLYCIRTLALLYAQTKQRIRDRLQDEQWQLGFLSHTGHATDKALRDFKKLNPPKGTIWADPQVLVENEQSHVFIEELDLEENLGRIAHAVLTPNGFEKPPVTVLETDHHLSYPFVFKHENDFYLIPETASTRTISLYRAKNFPTQWERCGSLIDDINAADTTMFYRDGRWWLFTSGISHEAVDERDLLLLFYSDDLLSGSWTPHPLNPIVTGVDRARMAGPLYERDGELFRPSQFGANRYGFGINIAKITTLSTTEYIETLVGRLTPTPSSQWIGCHTATHTSVNNEPVILIDRLQRMRKLFAR